MKNSSGKLLDVQIELRKLLIILVIFLVLAGIFIYNATFYVIIRFDELGHLTKNMNAYYNGFKIGKIVSIEPDNDFKHTLAKVNLNRKNINLPQNTTVQVKSFPNGEIYLEFVYPSSPSFKMIKRGEILEGIAKYNLEEFMLGQNISGISDLVSLHVIRALDATEIANNEIKMFFQNTSKLVQKNDQEISASVKNTAAMTKSLAQMAENLNQASKKINNALSEKDLKNTTSNIKDTTVNLAKASKDINQTIKNVDDTVAKVNDAAQNLRFATCELNKTLSKRFAGVRIMFGTPIKQKNCTRNACQ